MTCVIKMFLNMAPFLWYRSLNSNNLKSIPRELGNLTLMERFSLHINELESLPEELGNCTELDSL